MKRWEIVRSTFLFSFAFLLVHPVQAFESGTSGACCIGTQCIENLAATDCADNGGIWQGAGSICMGAVCVNPPSCPPGARLFLNEDDCGAYQNTIFQTCCVPQITPPVCWLNTGFSAICASASAGNGFRDQDLWSLSPSANQYLSICVTAPFNAHVQLFEVDDPAFIDLCDLPGNNIVSEVFGAPGVQSCFSVCVRGGGTYGILATIVDAAGVPMLEGVGCSQYVIESFVGDCPVGPCCIPPFGTCEILTALECADTNGSFLGAGLLCNDVACEPNIQFCDPNCDGVRTVADIGYFVTALTQGEAGWANLFPSNEPSCVFQSNDINGDGFVTVADISGYVACLIAGD